MKALRPILFALILVGFNIFASAQAPICDVTCSPNTTLPSYGGAAAARGKPLNARGSAPLTAQTAFVPKGRYHGGPAEMRTVSTVVGSQSYNYVIPILSLPGRDGLDLNLNLYYNSRVWDVDTTGGTVSFNADRDFPSYGFRLDFGYLEFLSDNSIVMTKADGTKAIFDSVNWFAQDGSNMAYSAGTVSFTDGTKMVYQAFPSNANLLRPITVKDRNGNFISITYVSGHDLLISTITDTVGRVITFNYDPMTMQLQSISQAVHPSGNWYYANFTWINPYLTGYSWYNFSPLTVNGAPTASQFAGLGQCTYPNSTGYTFHYGDWGIIDKIDHFNALGSVWNYVSYNYPAASAGALSDAPAYTQQTVSPDGSGTNTSVWSFATTKSGPGVVTSMAVTDPVGNVTTTNLNGSGLTSSVQVKDSSSTVLQTTAYTWTSGSSGSALPATVITTNDAGQQSEIQYAYSAWDNISDIYEYDFGLSLKRHTVMTYVPYSGTPHIDNLTSRISIKDGSGNVIARTDFAYDGSALSSITGASNHDDAGYGTSYTTRGNVTSITRYSNASAGTGALTQAFSYDTLGNARIASADCCNTLSSSFSSATQYSAPDSIVRGPIAGPQFTTSFTYNFDNNDVLSSTDENGQQTTYLYDSMNRLTATLLPAQGGTVVQLNSSFNDSANPATITNSTTNSGNTSNTVTTVDGLGHTLQLDNNDGGTTVGSTKYVYDKLWRSTQVSNPFAPGATPVYTTFAYDGLSRTTQITPPSTGYTQLQYSGNSVTITDPSGKLRKNYSDALGRLIEVDEPGWGDAEPGKATISIGGNEQSICTIFFNNVCHHTVSDSGFIYLTVNGTGPVSVPYGSSSTIPNLTSALITAINGATSFPVTAAPQGSGILLTAQSGGSITNYSLSSTATTSDPTDFSGPSFGISLPTPAALSGGVNATPQSSPTLARAFATTYAYDVMDDVTSASLAATSGPVSGVTYIGQPHSYTYDGLGRLTSSVTPEAGTVNTFYTDAGGSLCATNVALPCRRQDARGIVKTLTYDGVNRPLTISYSDTTPGVTFAYDAGGSAAFALDRLTSVTENSNSQIYTYDNLGHVKSVTENVDAVAYPVQYSYNLLGQITTITYPSGRVVTQSYDSIGRMASLASGSVTYLNGLSYNAAGQMLGMTLGNGIQGSFSYNDHQQLATLRYFKSGLTTDPLNLSYDYTSATQVNNNGQIQAVHYFTQPGVEDLTKTELFTYDPWARLAAAQTSTVNTSTVGTWSLTWSYDRLGNRKQQTLVNGDMPGGVNQPNFTMDETTNRVNGFSYDGSGNLSGDSAFTYTYDGAGRMKQAQQVASPNTITATTYFGQLRIKKVVGSNTTRYIYSGSVPVAEYVNGSLSKEYLYAGSSLLTTIAGATTTYHHPDHLSIRAETDATGTTVNTMGNLPYGDIWYGSSADQFKFGNYVRDNSSGETGLDYAQARFYSTAMGRFMSRDPIGGMLSTPQSVNSYSYVGGDPVNRTDPTGMQWRGDALCSVITDSTSKSFCGKFGSGGADGDNELFGAGSIACGGVSIVGSYGPSSFCSTAPGCPVFEIFMCDGFGSASSVLGINWTANPNFDLGPSFTCTAAPAALGSDGSFNPNDNCQAYLARTALPNPFQTDKNPIAKDILGSISACSLTTWVELGCDLQIAFINVADPTVIQSKTYVANFSTYAAPAIAPRGPFTAPPPHPPSTRLP